MGMNLTPENKTKLQIGHYALLWGILSAIGGSVIVFANDLENEQVRGDERQKELIKKIEKQESTNKAIKQQLQDNRDILIEIRTRQGQ